jgi:hypothetical protein
MIDDDDDECGAVSGMRIGSRNRSTEETYPSAISTTEIPHDLTGIEHGPSPWEAGY